MDPDELAYLRTLALLERGDSGAAVHAAGQLVESLRGAEPAADRARLADAMALLARAFAADGDRAGAEGVTRAMARDFAPDGSTPDPVAHARASALRGRYLRELGRLDESLSQLEATLERLGRPGAPAPDATPGTETDSALDSAVATEAARVRAELALSYLELDLVGSAIEVAYGLTGAHSPFPPGIRRLVAGVCAALGRRAPGEQRSADAVLFLELAVELLADDDTVEARRERAALCVALAQSLAALGRVDELQQVCAACFDTYREDGDPETLASAVVAACLDAQTSVSRGQPEAAGALARQLTGLVPASHPHQRELEGRIGLILASVELETRGAAAGERAYARVVSDLRDSPDPGVRLFLAFALDMECAVLGQLDRLDEAAATGRELGQLVAGFPTNPDFATVAECGNRTAIRLTSRGRPADAAAITRAVVNRRAELLDGPDAEVCIRAYVLLCDALRMTDDPVALNGMWHEILELGEPALAVLDGLAAHYRGTPELRTPLVYTYIGRIGVLARLGREDEARAAVRELFTEFGDDSDPQVRSILSGLRRAEGPEDPRRTEGPEDPFPDL